MTLTEFDTYINSFLRKEDFDKDISLNGIQIQNSQPSSKQIRKIAFAVDACEATAKAAVAAGADVLFVHHGLLWGRCEQITGSFYKRISTFIKNDLALCAYHIPLDANNPYGNNFGLALKLGLENCEQFGEWRGMVLGVKGELPAEQSIEELTSRLIRPGKSPRAVLSFGKSKIKTVGVISGGASEEVRDAVDECLDCYITGEFNHEDFHFAEEMGINVIAAGHYETETVGVSLVMQKVQAETDLECVFIDKPTGL
jgi:dinuclear metal center YbgI/SA1388 family protein